MGTMDIDVTLDPNAAEYEDVASKTTSWNYRLVGSQDDWGQLWGIFEVYYDDDGKILGRTVDPIGFVGENREEVIESLRQAINDAVVHESLWYDGVSHVPYNQSGVA